MQYSGIQECTNDFTHHMPPAEWQNYKSKASTAPLPLPFAAPIFARRNLFVMTDVFFWPMIISLLSIVGLWPNLFNLGR